MCLHEALSASCCAQPFRALLLGLSTLLLLLLPHFSPASIAASSACSVHDGTLRNGWRVQRAICASTPIYVGRSLAGAIGLPFPTHNLILSEARLAAVPAKPGTPQTYIHIQQPSEHIIAISSGAPLQAFLPTQPCACPFGRFWRRKTWRNAWFKVVPKTSGRAAHLKGPLISISGMGRLHTDHQRNATDTHI